MLEYYKFNNTKRSKSSKSARPAPLFLIIAQHRSKNNINTWEL